MTIVKPKTGFYFTLFFFFFLGWLVIKVVSNLKCTLLCNLK